MGRRRTPLPPELEELSSRMRELAGGQGGAVSAAQCRGIGADKASIRRLLDAGDWRRARRGTYFDPRFRPPDPAQAVFHQRCAALLAALARPAVISHGSAARLLRLPQPPGPQAARIRLTRRPPGPPNDPLGGDVHVRDYDEADVLHVGGVPVLGGARLVLDCCASMPPDSALAVADAWLRRGMVTHDDLIEAAEMAHRPERQVALKVAGRADRGSDNWFESMSRWWLLEAGLPVPQLQACFADRDGEIRARVDRWFPGRRTIGEADGAGKYDDEPGALFAEKQREDWLRDAHRAEVVRWVPAEMRSSGGRSEVVDRFHRAFARRA